MKWKKEFIAALQADLKNLKAKNPRFSLRAYSKRLELSHSALSQILSEKQNWNLTELRAAGIVEKLEVPNSTKERLFSLLGVEVNRSRERLKERDYSLILDWLYSAVLCSHDLNPAQREPDLMAQRFGVSLENVQTVLGDLEALGFLVKDENQNYMRNPRHWMAGDGPPAQVVRQHHKNNLRDATYTIDELPPSERDFSSMTFAGSLKRMEEFRKEVRLFHEKVMSLMQTEDENDEVFRFSVNLFPVRSQLRGVERGA